MTISTFKVGEIVDEVEKAFEPDKDRGLKIERKQNWVKHKEPQTEKLSSTVLKKVPPEVIKLVNRRYSSSNPFDMRRDCFSHQVEALEHIFNGKNVAVVTPTASGKSLCYQIPILSEMIRSDDSTALLIFPTNALSTDQIQSITSFGQCKSHGCLYQINLNGKAVWAGEYSGATKEAKDQASVRKLARIVLTNPDSIHAKILPYPKATRKVLNFKSPDEDESNYSFERFLNHLNYVVLDEIHVYRGVFGANVAYVMRRLRLMCEKLGNRNIRFICCSATISNPGEHAQKLVGLPFVVVGHDGAPKYRKDFLLWNPPQKSKGGNERRESTTDALEIFERLIAKWKTPIQTLIFLPSVKMTNSFDNRLRGMLERVHSPYKGKTVAFTRPLVPAYKREVQSKIKNGEILFISATSALELGIDIGDLSCCLLIGYPGNVASTLQRAGRVGRIGESLIVLLLNDELLQQYFANHPDVFFKLLENPGDVKIPLGNRYLLLWHLKCALVEERALKGLLGAFEGYSVEDYENYFGGDVVELLAQLEKECKIFRQNKVYWVAKGWGEPGTLHLKSIRVPISDREFNVVERTTGREIGRIDYYRAGLFFHEGAIWLQEGKYYIVSKYSRPEARIEVDELSDDPGYETNALPRHTIKVIREILPEKGNAVVTLHYGDVTNTRSINVFIKNPTKDREKKKQEIGIVTNVEPIEYDTTAAWIVFEDKLIDEVCKEVDTESAEDPAELFERGLHGLAHLLVSATPLLTECDRHDIGYQIFSPHRDIGKSTLFLLDTFHGGVGLSKEVYDHMSHLLDLCDQMLDVPEKLTTFIISAEAAKEIEKHGRDVKVESLGELVVVDKELVKAIIRHLRRASS
jgi:DEAD/DEAH box helicase domain-containing protein